MTKVCPWRERLARIGILATMPAGAMRVGNKRAWCIQCLYGDRARHWRDLSARSQAPVDACHSEFLLSRDVSSNQSARKAVKRVTN